MAIAYSRAWSPAGAWDADIPIRRLIERILVSCPCPSGVPSELRGMVSSHAKHRCVHVTVAHRPAAPGVGTSIELFTGGGGLAMAMHRTGFRHLLCNEFAPHACETLR